MAPKKRNGFYFYMVEMKNKLAAEGRRYKMDDMATIAHPMWKELSIVQKETYERMAKEAKSEPGGKLASDGTRIEDNFREIEEGERKERKMIQNIKTFINADCGTIEEFQDYASRKPFYILSFNILCRTENNIFIPIEVGLCEYSIQYGLIREYHRIINPGSTPPGYAGEAKRHSEDKHQITILDHKATAGIPHNVLNDILTFLNPKDAEEFPPVFCLDDYLDLTCGCLHWLFEMSVHPQKRPVINVWKVAYLLMELRAGVGQALPSRMLALELLLKSSFDYYPGARCAFHDECDCPHCALAYSKRLCYLLSDAVCELFDVVPTENHIPNRSTEEKDYEIGAPSLGKNCGFAYGQGIGRGNPRPSALYDIKKKSLLDLDDFDDDPPKNVRSECRQPRSSSLAQEMNGLRMNTPYSALPSHGIGRGRKPV